MTIYNVCVIVQLLIINLPLALSQQPPNIVLIIADDLGWDGVGYHGSIFKKTPNIDALAYDGIILNNYYTQFSCSPSRAALLTGRYPIHTGFISVIAGSTPYGLQLQEKLLPEYLKEIGYSTHILGKWHLGSYAEEYLPTNRGYDSFYGSLHGRGDYFSHNYWQQFPDPVTSGYDFWDGTSVDKSVIGKYTTEILSSRAEEIIRSHNQSQPLFLNIAHQGVHNANPNDFVQAPTRYSDRYSHITDNTQRVYGGMHSALDDSVANVTKALIRAGMINNTVIVFTSDNGGSSDVAPNWPLRGAKVVLWEGGTRVPAFIWSPLLEKSNYVSNKLMHISDWFPTLLRIAGHNMSTLPYNQMDGIDMWDVLSGNLNNSLRTEVLYGIQPDTAALRVNNMKIILGSKVKTQDWYHPFPDSLLQSEDSLHQISDPTISDIPFLLSEALGRDVNGGTPTRIDCGDRPLDALTNCNIAIAPCLFDLDKDPCEYNNLASVMPEKVTELLEGLARYNATAVPTPLTKGRSVDKNSYPIYHCGEWGPWINLHDKE